MATLRCRPRKTVDDFIPAGYFRPGETLGSAVLPALELRVGERFA